MIARLFLTLLCTASLSATLQAAESERLISTDAGATELLLALGLGDQLVAMDVTSQLPPGHPELPSVGYHRNLSAEGMLSLAPTAVIGSEDMGPPGVVATLRDSGVRLIQLPLAANSDELLSSVETLAHRLEREAAGDALKNALQRQLAALRDTVPTSHRAAFLLNMNNTGLRLAGAETAGNGLIELLGADNVADFLNYRSVSAEALLALQPSLILVVGNTRENAVRDLLTAHPVLQHSEAVQRGRILAVDGNALVAGVSVATVDEAARLANVLAQDGAP